MEHVKQALEDWRTLSPVVIVASAVVFMSLEHLFPYDRGQRLFRKGWFNDFVLYTLVQSYVLGFVIFGVIGWLDTHASGRLHILSAWPLWAQILFFLVSHDFYIYCFHRMQHRFPLLWRLHEAHHSVENVDWLAGSRSHALEILINQTIEFAPIVLLGAPPEMAPIKATLDAVWGMYIHSNIGVKEGLLQYFINGPEAHRWHHSVEFTGYGFNYSTKLAVWDWIFGTMYLPDKKPPGYGVADVAFPEEVPGAWSGATAVGTSFLPCSPKVAGTLVATEVRNYVAQQLFAFRRRRGHSRPQLSGE
jgi:sterol desaturase/sphingolipid hydroxylase (fatty acid hydroxylase superfamily)